MHPMGPSSTQERPHNADGGWCESVGNRLAWGGGGPHIQDTQGQVTL